MPGGGRRTSGLGRAMLGASLGLVGCTGQPYQSPPGGARGLGPLDDARRFLTWMALLACLSALARWWGRRRRTRDDRLMLGGLLAISALALLLRLVLPPWAPVHANDNGVGELLRLLGPGVGGTGQTYGVAQWELLRFLTTIVGRSADSIFALTAVAGALSVVPLGLFTATVLESRPAGLFAALALAIHPAHIRLSLSESPFAWGGLLFLIALAAAAATRAPDAPRRLLAWTTGLALACLVELCIPTVVLGAVVVLSLFVWRAGKVIPAIKLFAAPLGVALLATVLYLYSLWPVLAYAWNDRAPGNWTPFHAFLLSPVNIVFDPSLTSPLLVPLAAAGLVALLVRRRVALALTTLVAVALPYLPGQTVEYCRTDYLRYQTLAHFGLWWLAAAALTLLPCRASPGLRWSAALGLSAALAFSTVPGLEALRLPDLGAQTFEVARRAAALLPNDAYVLVPPRRMGPINEAFPAFLVPPPEHVVTQEVSAIRPPSAACFVWIDSACYAFSSAPAAAAALARFPSFRGAPVQPACGPLVHRIDPAAKPLAAATLSVPWADEELFRSTTPHPLVGLFPCKPP